MAVIGVFPVIHAKELPVEITGLKIEIKDAPDAWTTKEWVDVENNVYILYAGNLRNDAGEATKFKFNMIFSADEDVGYEIKSVGSKEYTKPVIKHTEIGFELHADVPRSIPFKLVSGSEQKVPGNLIFCPMEILVPATDEEGNITDGLLWKKGLKIGKMNNPDVLSAGGKLTIDNDPDCFYFRILGGAELGKSSFTLKTIANSSYVGPNPQTNYSNPEVKIDFLVKEEGLISKSMLLVSDAVDDSVADNDVGADDEPNDRSHIINLGGKVHVTKIEVANAIINLNNFTKTALVRKKIDGMIFIMDEEDTDEPIDSLKVAANREIMKERFAQLGLKANISFKRVPLPDSVNVDDIQIKNMGEGTSGPGGTVRKLLKDDAKAIIDSVRDEDGNLPKIVVFYIPKMAMPIAAGIAIFPLTTHPDDIDFINVVFIDARIIDARPFTLPHEIFHLLSNAEHYGDDYPKEVSEQPSISKTNQNLMRAGGTSEKNEIGESKRLTLLQENMADSHGLIENP